MGVGWGEGTGNYKKVPGSPWQAVPELKKQSYEPSRNSVKDSKLTHLSELMPRKWSQHFSRRAHMDPSSPSLSSLPRCLEPQQQATEARLVCPREFVSIPSSRLGEPQHLPGPGVSVLLWRHHTDAHPMPSQGK